MAHNLEIKCKDCTHLKKRHKILDDKEYFRMCLQTKEYMDIMDTKILHDCKNFQLKNKKRKR